MTVTVQTPFTEYIAAPGATTFATTFRLIELGDLLVTVNGAIVTSGFAVGGLPLGPTASVVFAVPMVGGEAIKLERVIKLERQNNYQFEGDFQANVVNEDFDRLWMSQQDQEQAIDNNLATQATVNARTLRAPLGEVLNELPAAAVRANKVQAFDSSGQPIAVLPGTGTASEVLINLAGTGPGQGAKILGYTATENTSEALDRVGPGKPMFAVARQTVALGGWLFLNDAGHAPRGFSTCAVDGSNNLVLNYDYTAGKVGQLLVGCDETFAALGLQMGASVALDKATVSFFKTLDFALNLSSLAIIPSTFFAGDVSVVNNGDGTVTVTHPSCGSAAVVPCITQNSQYPTRLLSYNATSFTIESLVNFTGYISYDGAAWQVITPARIKPTMVFSGNALTVTHEALPTAESDVQITGRDSATALANLGSSGATTFQVFFRDYTGAIIAAPTTDMRIRYSGTVMVRREVNLGNIACSRANCKLDANKVASGSGNVWICGDML